MSLLGASDAAISDLGTQSPDQWIADCKRWKPGEVAVGRPQLGHAVRKADRGDARVVNRPPVRLGRQRQRLQMLEVIVGLGDGRNKGFIHLDTRGSNAVWSRV